MTCTNFPSTGLVANVTEHQVGDIIYIYKGDGIWESDGPPLDLVKDLSQAYIFDTVALFKASLIEFPDGKTIHLNDRGADFIKISGQSGTGYVTIPSNSINQSVSLMHNRATLNLLKVGYIADGGTLNDDAINDAQRFMVDSFGGGELLYPLGVGMIGRGIRLDSLNYSTGIYEPGISLNIKHSGVSKEATILRAATAINSVFSSFPEWGGVITGGVTGTGGEIFNLTIDCDYDNLADGGALYGANYEAFTGQFPDGSSSPSNYAADNYQYPIYTFLNEEIIVRNVIVLNSWYNGVEIYKSENIKVIGCDIQNCGDKANFLGFYSGVEIDNGSKNIRVLNNNIKNVGYGVFSNGGPILTNTAPVEDVIVSGNIIENVVNDGISGFDWLDTWKIHDNIIKNVGKEPIKFTFVDPGASGNTEKHCQNFEIYNNTVDTFNTDNTVRTAIRFQGHSVKITNNKVKNLDPLVTSNTYGIIASDSGIAIPSGDVQSCTITDNEFIGVFAGDSQNVAILNIAIDEAVVKRNTLYSTTNQCYAAARIDADNVTYLDNEMKGAYISGAGKRPNVRIGGTGLLMDDDTYRAKVELKVTAGLGGLSGTTTADFDGQGVVLQDNRGNFTPASNSFTADYEGIYNFTALATFGSSSGTCTAYLEKNGTTLYGASSSTSSGRLDISSKSEIPMNAGDTVRLRMSSAAAYVMETNTYMKGEWVSKL